VKLVHLVGFIVKKFVTIHGHMNVKLTTFLTIWPIIIEVATRYITQISLMSTNCILKYSYKIILNEIRGKIIGDFAL
jgi:hypothetical protein